MIALMEAGEFRRTVLAGDRFPELNPKVAEAAATVLEEVRREGDEGLSRATKRFDKVLVEPGKSRVSPEEIDDALEAADPALLEAMEASIARVRRYHRLQRMPGFVDVMEDGTVAGQLIRPLARVGLYVPGGRAPYPSSLIMNAVPAQIARVPQIAAFTPPGPDGRVASSVLVAAGLLGIEELHRAGGVQAVAAMAYGTETIDAVDKIVGPGNSYVTAAKKLVLGVVGIDGIAGPSEVAVICDESSDAERVALDLLAQAEHDPEARCYLLCTDSDKARAILGAMERKGPKMERWEIISAALDDWGGALVASEDELWDLVNAIAPEHLSIQTRDPWAGLTQVQNAGAVFLGSATGVSFGDYSAGPNHVLPTAGTAKYASPLSVGDFVKRSSYLYLSESAAAGIAPYAARLAEEEGLTAHAEAARVRGGEDE